MSVSVSSATCGSYELVAQRPDSLHERKDGGLEVVSEASYLIRLAGDAPRNVLRDALKIPHGGSEGVLQFGNFIGTAELGGRAIVVRSNRLSAHAAEAMLDAVAERLASLPFGADTPTAVPYMRERSIAPDALYHAFAFLRDAMRPRGPHDVPSAMERILAKPHETLRVDEPRVTPLARMGRIDFATLAAIQSEPELLGRVAPNSPLAAHPLAERLKGRMPELVRTRPTTHTTDNRENRFVVATLDAVIDVARRFDRFARIGGRASSAVNASEARDIADRAQRWKRHRALESLDAGGQLPLQSTVLRGRPGYRELLRFYTELLARTRHAAPHDMQALLELRDAALIYEYWCYFEVVDAVTALLGPPAEIGRFESTAMATHVPYRYHAEWEDVQVVYNLTYSRPTEGPYERGRDSYSVRLRPDVSIHAGGKVHLFDAKLKVNLFAAVDGDDIETTQPGADTFKREDLYKMHAYRDALGADTVWVLYPGSDPTPNRYEPWWATADDASKPAGGVGAISLRPGAPHDGGLHSVISELLESAEPG